MALVPIIAINTYVGSKLIEKKATKNDVALTTNNVIEIEEHMSPNTSIAQLSRSDEQSMTMEGNNESNIPDNEELDVLKKLHQVYSNNGTEVETILCNTDNNSELYISALYEKTLKKGISEEDLRRELNNILVYSLLYTDLTDEEWEYLFGNLQRTLTSEYINVLEYYYPLAAYLHLQECQEEHHHDYIDSKNIVCNSLNEEADKVFKNREYYGYIDFMIYSSEDKEIISSYERIYQKSDNPELCINELSNLYIFSQVPRCISEEELEYYFSNLQSTVTEYENIFEVYRKLAIYLHLLNCDYEHYIDECDVHVCKGLKKSYGND